MLSRGRSIKRPITPEDVDPRYELEDLAETFHSIYLEIRNRYIAVLDKATSSEKARIHGACLDQLEKVVRHVQSAFEEYEHPYRTRMTREFCSDREYLYAHPIQRLDYLYDHGEYYIHQSGKVYRGTVNFVLGSGPRFKTCLKKMKKEIGSMEPFIYQLRRC